MKALAVFVAFAAALVACAAAVEYVVPEWRGTPLVVGGQLPDYMTSHSGCVCPPAPKCAAVPCPPAPACACQSRWTVGKPRVFVAKAHYQQLDQKGTPSGGTVKEFVAPEVVSRSNVGAAAGSAVLGSPVAPPATKGTPSGLNSPLLTASSSSSSSAPLPAGLVADANGFVTIDGDKVPAQFAAAFAQSVQNWNVLAAKPSTAAAPAAAAAVSAPPAAAVIPTPTPTPAAAAAQPVSPPPAVVPATDVSPVVFQPVVSAPLVQSDMHADVVQPRYSVVYFRRRWHRSERKAKRLAARSRLRLRLIRALRRRVRYFRTAGALFRAKLRAARRWRRFRHRAARMHVSRRLYRVQRSRYVRVARRYRTYVGRMKRRMHRKAHRRLKRRLRR